MLIPEASISSQLVDRAFLRVLWMELAVLIPITVTMIFFILKYHEKKHPVPQNIEGSTLLEITWTVIPTLLVLVIFYIGLIGFDKIRTLPPEVMTVKVIGRQWAWQFAYANGKETDELYVPIKKPLKLILTSKDVVHSFYVPAFRVKEDCVPGMENYLSITVEQPGKYDIFCTEYCGLGHSGMVSKIVAMEEKDFNTWYATVTKSGRELLGAKGCLGCHTIDGSARIGPTFKGLYESRVTVTTNGKERIVIANDDYLRRSIDEPQADIVKGYPPIMPVIPLKPGEIESIVEYIEGLK